MITLDEMNTFAKQTLVENLGITFTKSAVGYLEATMPVDERTCQTYGLLHGGATIALAETVAGMGTFNLTLPEKACVGMQISASHLSSALKGETVIAKGSLIHKGRTTHVWDVNIYEIKSERLISTIRVTNAIINHKKRAQTS